MRTRPLLAALLTLALLLVACGGEDDDDDSRPAGRAAKGTGYTVTMPGGWSDHTKKTEGGIINFDLLLGRPPRDGFAVNVMVLREPYEGDAPKIAELRTTIRESMRASGAKRVRDAGDRRVDGAVAITHDYRQTSPAGPVRGRQVAVNHKDAIYSVTLTTLADGFEAQLPVLNRLLASWTWEDGA
ncbi:MAG: hypothetical protein Q8O56_02425 [Solirubrobacteraceae bacterium]|nr:hypothetical protein [Solirubrobacteraceae bacterium]